MANQIDSANAHVAKVEDPNWPDLVARTVDDLSHLARTEIQLFEATLKRLIEAQTEKVVGALFLVVALAYGSLFLLGGIVLLLHLWLAWWLSFLITGGAIVGAGVFFQMAMRATARKTES
ncbi:MAG: phage holin family protein [Candidatus Binataceae bacterium]|nr:phage holin family protein [Candidatus Binataceae bacterium]